MLVDLTTQLDKTQRLLRQLMEAKSGTRSEQLSADQLRLFAQELGASELAQPTAVTETPEDDDDLPPGSGSGENQEKSHSRGRRPLPSHLKRERIEHDLTEPEKHCAGCGQDLRPIGEETSERYEYMPAQLLVIEDVCKKYACACTVKTATKPPQPIEKSAAGASLLAHVIVSKIADHVPLHWQGKIFSRWGADIADQTMGGSVGGWPRVEFYRCADGKLISLQAMEAKFWANFCAECGRGDLIGEPSSDDPAVKSALWAELSAIFASRSRAEWIEAFVSADIAGGPVNTLAELAADPHFLARSNTYGSTVDGTPEVRLIASPVRVDGATFAPEPPPALGADQAAVLRDWLGAGAVPQRPPT